MQEQSLCSRLTKNSLPYEDTISQDIMLFTFYVFPLIVVVIHVLAAFMECCPQH